MKLSEILHAGRKFIPESKYVPKFIKFIKVLGEVINGYPFHDVTKPKLEERKTRFIFVQQISSGNLF